MKTEVNEELSADVMSKKTPVIIGGSKAYLLVKRVFDIVVAAFAGVLLLIPMIILAVLIRIDSKGPALFSQERLGENGKPF